MEAGRFGGCEQHNVDGRKPPPHGAGPGIGSRRPDTDFLSEDKTGMRCLPLVGPGHSGAIGQTRLGVDTTGPSHGSRAREQADQSELTHWGSPLREQPAGSIPAFLPA